ncbi:MAG TPA: M14 family zinc carboxypeptidase [Opitutaceae bacterium]|nr:M14 family zinc carboxypeptidase [Opitutaceae bacterium]HND62469.1 M14 family zinc carboxypeptidase [Opitutaceae bacterium]
MTLLLRLGLAIALLGGSAAVRAAGPDVVRPLLVEVAEVPVADQQKGGRFDYSDYNRKELLSLVRDRALLLATPEEFAALQRDGYRAKVVMESRDPLTLYRRAFYGPTLKLPEIYHSYDRINARADELMRQFPQLITRIQIGETTQFHRPIYAYRLSNDARRAQPRPGVLYTGCHHSDEVMGAEIVTALMQDLVLGYGHDAAATRWLDQCEVYLVPVVNVDGHDIVTSSRDPRWRKNARDVNGDGVTGVFPEGVDVNRGYDYNWTMGGSDVPEKDTYRGPYPFSEAENRAIRHLLELKSFVLSISYHSQGEVIYYPWSWAGQPAPDDALIKEIANQMAARLVTMSGNGHYAVSPGGPSSQSYVWLYGRKGDFDFIIETGRGTHLFAPEEVPGIIATNLDGAKVLLDRAAGPGFAVHVTDAATGRPLVAQVWLPRIENESVDRRYTEGEFGRYWRPLRPGKYDVIISCPGYQTVVRPGLEVAPGAWTPLDVALTPSK